MNQNELTYINICLVGCVSAGKSTILNAFFGQDYAQCKIKRTTMMPNKFIETNDVNQIDSFETINKTITDTNKQIYTQTENGSIPLVLSDYGGELSFHVGNMEMNVGNKIKICIYDIPGLNDARTKNVYYDYLKNNFHKFNIILFVVDIHSGLNTSDEMDILTFLAQNIKMHKTASNKNIQMLTIVNKADDMQLTSDDNLEVLGELGEMFEQVEKTVKSKFIEQQIKEKSLGCIPICGLDAHLYRMIKKFKDINKLTDENILRIGINEEGSKFRKYSKAEQKNKVQNKIMDNEFVEDMIKLSGFSQIEVCLNHYIGSKGSTMVTENVLLDYGKITTMTIDNIIFNMKQRINLLSCLSSTNNEKYEEEMKKLIKQFNTHIYKKIHAMNSPFKIKQYYDELIAELVSDKKIKDKIVPFFNSFACPNYLTDRILELIVHAFSKKEVKLNELLSCFDIIESVTELNIDVVNLMLKSLMENVKEGYTFVFDTNDGLDTKKILSLFEKLKESDKFIEFIRFFLANMYTTMYVSLPDLLMEKMLLLTKHGELPLRQFISDLRIEKGLCNTRKNISLYCKGLSLSDLSDNGIHELEFYYLEKCKEAKDIKNFI